MSANILQFGSIDSDAWNKKLFSHGIFEKQNIILNLINARRLIRSTDGNGTSSN